MKLKGYVTSRSFLGERVPQHIQNIIIRDYCDKNKYDFLMSATEYSIPESTLMIKQIISELDLIDGIVAYSIFQLPENLEDRFDLIWSVFAFNMMQPSNELICKLLPQLRNKARFIIFDGNVDCFWLRLLKNRNREALNPNDFRMKLEENGLRKIKNFNFAKQVYKIYQFL